MNNKKGITKIGLIVLLTVLVISFSILIIHFTFNNPLAKALDGTKKEQIQTYQRELNSTLISFLSENPEIEIEDITAIALESIKKYIPSFKEEDYGIYEIVNGKVVLVN